VKEKVQPLKIINTLFLEPHTRYYMMLIICLLVKLQNICQVPLLVHTLSL